MKELRAIVKKNLPKGFQEAMGYSMVGYMVPHTLIPQVTTATSGSHYNL